MLTSYTGSVVRREVPITCDDWRRRELKPVKEKIWTEIQVRYVMSFVFVDAYVYKLLTHSMYVFCRGLLTLMMIENHIVFNWPEKD